MQSGLYVAPGLLEGLSLGDLCRVVGTDPNDVGAEEDQDVSAHLKHRRGRGSRSEVVFREHRDSCRNGLLFV